jgi:FimV-like protein
MHENIDHTEIIERYLEGELSQEERLAFEARLHAETALAEEVALHQHLRTGIQASGRNRMLDMLAETDRKMPAYHPPAQIIPFGEAARSRFYQIAAAVILLLIPLYLVLDYNRRPNKLFAAYFSPHQAVMVESGDPMAQAMQEYQRQNYAQALPILEKMLSERANHDTTLFYQGNSSLALGKADEAISSFEKLTTDQANPFYHEAQWYLALAYLKDKQPEKARNLLNSLSADANHPHQKQAAELLQKLK